MISKECLCIKLTRKEKMGDKSKVNRYKLSLDRPMLIISLQAIQMKFRLRPTLSLQIWPKTFRYISFRIFWIHYPYISGLISLYFIPFASNWQSPWIRQRKSKFPIKGFTLNLKKRQKPIWMCRKRSIIFTYAYDGFKNYLDFPFFRERKFNRNFHKIH